MRNSTFGRETCGRRHLGARTFGRGVIWARGHLGTVPFGREIRSNAFLINFSLVFFLNNNFSVCNDLIQYYT